MLLLFGPEGLAAHGRTSRPAMKSTLSVSVRVCLPGRSFSEAWSVANDRFSLFVVQRLCGEWQDIIRSPARGIITLPVLGMVTKLPNSDRKTLDCRNPILWKIEGQSKVRTSGWRAVLGVIVVCCAEVGR